MQLLCCASKLSTDQNLEVEAKCVSKAISQRLKQSHKAEQNCLKLLLLGTGESGKSTILKQMKIIHINGYTEKEKLSFVPAIRRNIRDAVLSVLGGMRVLGIDYERPENSAVAQQFLETSLMDECSYSESFFEHVNTLWRDQGVRTAYSKSSDYQLIDSAKYFLDRINIIRQKSYVPSDQDILRCRTMTDGISEVQFEITTERKTPVRFRVFDVSGQRGARKKWIQFFDSVTAILFLVDCGSFEQTLREDHNQNRLMDSLEVFEQAWSNKYLQNVPIIVFLNKIDVLDEKIRAGQRINRLHSVASTWLDSHELRKCDQFMLSLSDAHDKDHELDTSDSEYPGSHKNINRVRRYRTAAAADYPNHQNNFSKHSFTTSTIGMPLLESSHLYSVDECGSSLKHNADFTGTQLSIRASLSSFNRNLRMFSPINSVRRLRRSFRLASIVPVPQSSDSSGVTCRVSCTVLVARVILNNPYRTFVPSTAAQEEFASSIKFIARNSDVSGQPGVTSVRELRPPHRETVRTACYIKHLFQELTTQQIPNGTKQPSRRKCLFYYTCAVNTDSIRKVLEGCRTFLLEGHLDRCGLI